MEAQIGDLSSVDLGDVLAERAQASPDDVGYTVLSYRGGDAWDEENLTFAQLLDWARRIAARLLESASCGDRILILAPPGLAYVAGFYACQVAGMVAVPAYPPRNPKNMGRLIAMLGDAEASTILTTQDLIGKIRDWAGEAGGDLRLVAIGEDDPGGPAAPVERTRSEIAFLQYTSGTTGDPKGVIVSHAAALTNCRVMMELLGLQPGDVTASWLPPYHDMGLVTSVILPVVVGGKAVMMAPASFLQRPRRWLEAIGHYGATVVTAPNFGWQLCVDEIGDDEMAGLDLSCLRHALSGAEPVRAPTLEAFAARFARVGFRADMFAPVYGMAETVLISTGSVRAAGARVEAFAAEAMARPQPQLVRAETQEGARTLVGCGRVIAGHRIAIVEPETRTRLGDGAVGEVWLSGPSVAGGYWRDEAKTAATFGARIDGEDAGTRWLRTGDLGALVDGELFVLGRRKETVIVRGANHYPQDLETAAAGANEALKAGNIISFGIGLDRTGDPVAPHAPEAVAEDFALVCELDRHALRSLDHARVCEDIRRALVSEHGIEPYAVVLIKPLSLPRTTSGKLQRLTARDRFLGSGLVEVTRWTRAPAEPAQDVATAQNVPHARVAAPASSADRVARPLGGRSLDGTSDATREATRWLQAAVAEAIGVSAESVPVDQPIGELGVDSLSLVKLAARIEDRFATNLEASELYAYSTLAELGGRLGGADQGPTDAARAAAEAATATRAAPASGRAVAIAGMACRFPGAPSPEAFWSLLLDGRSGIGTVPDDMRAAAAAPGDHWSPGGYIQDIDRFDCDFFRIAPLEASFMDPQQRLLLETSWAALEDAGISPAALKGSRAGVFVGISTHDYSHLVEEAADTPQSGASLYRGTGVSNSVAAGRLAYFLGLTGPAVAIDTACSSSLVAVHNACRALAAGEVDVAICAGVNAIIMPELTRAFARAGMLSPDGVCKTFDAAADGYVRGEGVGVVVLRRVADAQADGGRIRALVKGIAINQDGASAGLTVPSETAQGRVIADALADAGLAGRDIDYLEAHGTGTELGDPIELRAAAGAYCADRAPGEALKVGSVKTNIGHLEAAAGIAGLMKVVLSLEHGTVPPHLNLTRPTPRVDWARLGLSVPTAAEALRPAGADESRPARAGLSSFGFSGTNAHAILEAYRGHALVDDGAPRTRILPLSGKTWAAVRTLAERYGAALGEGAPSARLADMAYTAATGRAHLNTRAAMLFRDAAGLAGELRALAGQTEPDGPLRRLGTNALAGTRTTGTARRRVAFVFAGQGSQRVGMGADLYASEPAFRAVLDRCEAVVQAERGVSLLDVMFGKTGAPDLIDDTSWTQPCLFALEAGLLALWRNAGVEPAAVLGHSVGEVAAAYAAGVFSLDEGIAFAARRGALMASVADAGSMLAVFADAEAVGRELASLAGTEATALSIAADNGPHQVVAGPALQIAALAEHLAGRGIAYRRLATSNAFHSALMDPILAPLEACVSRLSLAPPGPIFISNVTGRAFAPGEVPDGPYWRKHARQPVLFRQSVEALATGGFDTIVEIGPTDTLSAIVRAAWPSTTGRPAEAAGAGDVPVTIASLASAPDTRADAPFQQALAAAYVAGVDVDFAGLFAGEERRLVSLPTYPFAGDRHFVTRAKRAAHTASPVPSEALARTSTARGEEIVEADMSGALAAGPTAPFAFAALLAGAAWPPGGTSSPPAIRNFHPLAGVPALLGGAGRDARPAARFQVILSPAVAGDEARRAEVFVRHAKGEPWLRYAEADLAPAVTVAADHGNTAPPPGACAREGLVQADPALCGDGTGTVERVWIGEDRAVGEVSAPRLEAADHGPACHAPDGFALHPDLLDGALRLVRAALGGRAGPAAVCLPRGFEAMWLDRPVSGPLTVSVRLREGADHPRGNVADIDLYDREGHPIGAVRGCRVELLSGAQIIAMTARPEDLFYDVAWREAPAPRPVEPTRDVAWLVVADDRDDGASLAALLRRSGRRVVLAERLGDAPASDGAPTESAALERARLDHTDRAAWTALSREIGATDGLGGVIFIAGRPAGEETIAAAAMRTSRVALALAQGLRDARVTLPGGLVVATRGAQILGGEALADLSGAPLWGLGKTLAIEAPDLAPRMVDLDPDTADPWPALAAEALGAGEETHVAYRAGQRAVARLVRGVSVPDAGAANRIRSDRTYLVTGGLGGLGLHLAKWLAAQGAGALALVGRRGADAAATEAIAAIEDGGCRVLALTGDVTRMADVERILAAIDAELPPLGGLVHSAGVLADAGIDVLDWPTHQRVLEPKILGAANLHAATAGRELDLFVLMSSSAGLFGNAGQANHAAANAFLDGLARLRRRQGLAGQSLAWGPWADIGVAAQDKRDQIDAQLSAAGIGWLSPELGLAAFASQLCANAPYQAVVPIDWPTFLARLPVRPPFLDDFAGEVRTEPRPSAGHERDAIRLALAAADPSERRALVLSLIRSETRSVLKLAKEPAGEASFFDLGLDSLTASELVARLNRTLGTTVSPRALFDHETLAAFANAFTDAFGAPDGGGEDRIAVTAGALVRPVSAAQARALAIESADPGAETLNLSGVLVLDGPVDVDALEAACRLVVDRHEVLRTTYVHVSGPEAFEGRVGNAADTRLGRRSVGAGEAVVEIAHQEARRPVDPFGDSVFQAVLVTGEGADPAASTFHAALAIRVHHVAFDLVSFGIFQDEFLSAYQALSGGRAPNLAPQPIAYGDYAAWEAERLTGPRRRELVAFWRAEMAGAPVRLDLPFDRPRPQRPSAAVGEVDERIDAITWESLTRTAARHKVTPFVLLEVALAITCAGLSRADDIVVGTVSEGRHHPDLRGMIGLFVNTIPVRHAVDRGITGASLLAATQARLLAAIEHDELQFADIVSALNPPRSSSHDAVFQVFCQLRQTGGAAREAELGATSVTVEPIVPRGRGGDLTVLFDIDPDGLLARFSYSRDLFDAPTAAAIARLWRAVIEALGSDTQASVGALWERASANVPGVDPAAHARLCAGPTGTAGAWYALSRVQQDLWLAKNRAPAGSAFDSLVEMELPATVNIARLEAAIHAVIAECDALHLEIGPDGLQRAAPEPTAAVYVLDHSAAPRHREASQRVLDWHAERAAVNQQKTDFGIFLFPEHVVVAISGDHLLHDGWSGYLMLEAICANYDALTNGARQPLGGERRFLATLAADQRHAWSEAADADRAFWRERAADLPDASLLDVFADRTWSAAAPQRTGSVRASVPRATQAAIAELARELSISPGEVWVGLVGLYLGRVGGQERVGFVVPFLNRDRRSLRTPGQFANLVPIAFDVDDQPSIAALLKAVSRELRAASRHGSMPLGEIVHTMGANPSIASVSVNTLFTKRGPSLEGVPCPMRWLTSPEAGLSILVTQFGSAAPTELELRFNTARFDAETVERHKIRLLDLLSRVLDDITARPVAIAPLGRHETALVLSGRRQYGVGAGSAPARYQIIAGRAPAVAEPGADETVVDLMRQQAEARPAAIAVIDGPRELTYRELDMASSRLARHLIGHGAGPEAVVGVALERSAEWVVALLAIWKAGAAYLPLDPDYPRERLQFALEDSGATLVVSDGASARRAGLEAGELTGRLVLIDDADTAAAIAAHPAGPLSDAERLAPLTPDLLAYVIYTSGSTGKPKGVMVAHRSLANLSRAQAEDFGTLNGARIAQFAAASFDVSVGEVAMAVRQGGALVIVQREDALSPDGLARLVRERQIGQIELPPSLAASLDPADFAGKTVILSGEALPADIAARWSSRVRLVNSYGPTEATVSATGYRVPEGLAASERVAIGGPIRGVSLYVVNRMLDLMPIGVPGELVIGGVQVSRGYLGRPGLTAERFVADPFSGVPGARLYRTGDLARWRADGQLEFLGRIDTQVKVRGMRVELGEIEAALAAQHAVAQVAVVARPSAAGDMRLVAHIVPAELPDTVLASAAPVPADEPGEADRAAMHDLTGSGLLDLAALRANLRETLPEHMVPSGFVVLSRLPLTPSGKVDRKRLPEAEVGTALAEYAAPQGETEALVARAFGELLGTGRIGRHDNFFELGGHSLSAIQLVARVSELAARPLPIREIFETGTVAGIAAALDTKAHRYDPLTRYAAPSVGAMIGGRAQQQGAADRACRLVCVHPSSGMSAPFRQLADPVADFADVWGVSARGVDAGEAPFATYEEMVGTYLDALIETEDGQDLILLGWSFGGQIAVDLAQRAAGRGHCPVGLVLLDSLPWRSDLTGPASIFLEGAQGTHSAWRDRLLSHLAVDNASGLGLPAGDPNVAMVEAAVALGMVDPAATLADAASLDRLVRVWHALARIAGEMPGIGRGFTVPTLVVRAEDTRHSVSDPAMGWQAAASAIETVDVPFGHFDLMSAPAAERIANEIRGWLRRHGHAAAPAAAFGARHA